MRLIISLILLLSTAVLPYPASAEKAATIDELVKMYDITPCAGCHVDKYEEWKTSTMGNSIVDPRVLRGMRTFIRLALDGEKELDREDLTICLNCHIPQIKDATTDVVLHIGDLILSAVEDPDESKRDDAIKKLSRLNLNCLGCHNLKGTGFSSPPQEKTIYGPRDLGFSPHEGFGFKTVQSSLFTSSEFCAQCHHCPPSVPWEQCPDLYTSYVDDFIKKGHSETCQDCHMEGRKLSHKFLGPTNLDFLKSSVSLTVNARLTRYIDIYENGKMPAVVLQVTVKNHAGHEIPHG